MVLSNSHQNLAIPSLDKRRIMKPKCPECKSNACADGYEWSVKTLKDKPMNAEEFIKLLVKDEKYQWANWVLVRIFDKTNNIKYAIYAAEQVIDIYEKEYPDDKRPRKAIKAAKEYLKNPSANAANAAYAAANAANATYATANAANAAYAAANAANATYAAANAAANAANAAYAAANAANATYATANAAYAAAYSAANAAYAAYSAYAAAYSAANAAYSAANAAEMAMRIKIINYGIKLLKEF